VLSGQAQPDGNDATLVGVPVEAGRYRLTVRELNGSLEASQSFTAGWWLTQPTPATPQKIELTAHAEGEQGEAARIAIFIDPPFAARIWVAALNAVSGATPAPVDVPDEGGFAYLPRTDLQPGQPLTLIAYGVPADQAASLVQAEGSVTIPLGGKVTMAISETEPYRLTIKGLPIDQPLDRNIAQGMIAYYDEATKELLRTARLEIDTSGTAVVELPRSRPP
jgi:hypothetical protein